MKMQIVVLKDIVANCYGQPIFVPNLGGAIRSFADQIKHGQDETMKRHPEHFELYHLGAYDDQTAELETIPPQQIAVGANFKEE